MSARVRVATDHEGGLVAIKAARTAVEREALRYEAVVLRQCAHPGVVALVAPADLGEPLADDELATRYAGEPLDRWRGDLRRVAGLTAAVAATLGDLHDMGVVHGRLDGSHVLVGSDGRPRLCGFAPPGDHGPADDVLALGLLGLELVERMVPSEPRWPLWRRGDVADRRAFLEVLRQATDDEPARRPSAQLLAAALLRAVPEAELPVGEDDSGAVATGWAGGGAIGVGGGDDIDDAGISAGVGAGVEVGGDAGVEVGSGADDTDDTDDAGLADLMWPWASATEPTVSGPSTVVGVPAEGGAPTSPHSGRGAGGGRTGETGPASGLRPHRSADDRVDGARRPGPAGGTDTCGRGADASGRQGDQPADGSAGDRPTHSTWSPAVAPSRFVRPEDRTVVGGALVTGADDPTEDEDPWRSRLLEPGVGGLTPTSGDGDDRTEPVDPLFGDQSSAELDEVFADRPWPAEGSGRRRRRDRAPRHPSPPRRRRAPRRRLTGGLPAAPVVAGLAAAVVGAVTYFGGWTVPFGLPSRSAAPPDCPSSSASTASTASTASAAPASASASSAPVVDIDGDGCGEALTIAAGVVTADDRRWRVAEPDDSVVVADWDCDGRATPAVYRVATGDVFVFDGWADASGPLEVAAVGSVVGGTRIADTATDDPCPTLAIEMPDGEQHPVEVGG